MRLFMGLAALSVIAAAYTGCPETLQTQIKDTVTPSETTLRDMRDGIDTLKEYLRGIDEFMLS